MYTFDIEILLSVTAFFVNAYLGLIVLLKNPRSATNVLFACMALLFNIYVVTNFFSLHPGVLPSGHQLVWFRAVFAGAAFMGPVFFLLVGAFPGERLRMKAFPTLLLLSLPIVVAFLSFGPFMFTQMEYRAGTFVPAAGPAVPLFFLVFAGFLVLGLFRLFQKMRAAQGLDYIRLRIFFYGALASSIMGVGAAVSVAVLQNTSILFLGPIFQAAFMVAVAYAILKYQLFDIQLIAAEVFVAFIAMISLVRIFTSETSGARIVDILIASATVFFGVLINRSVKEEIRSREKIHELAKRLSETNWELGLTNEQLRIIDQRKNEFVSIVSHQLRTPLTAIKGYASMLLESSFGKLSPEQKIPVEKIFVSSLRLVEMVTDFLDISKIEQGMMVFTFRSLDIRAMLEDLVEEFTPVATQKGLMLAFAYPEGETFVVTADRGKTRQILSNLIDNAIKYTPEGRVDVTLEKNTSGGTVICRVKDTGIGLSQDDIHHLFGKFTRGTGGQKQYTDGSGIGLYVAKKMMEGQHGKIWVDSEGPGKGSIFAIELLAEEEEKDEGETAQILNK